MIIDSVLVLNDQYWLLEFRISQSDQALTEGLLILLHSVQRILQEVLLLFHM